MSVDWKPFHDEEHDYLMNLFIVYCGFLHSNANCILVQLYPLGIIALSENCSSILEKCPGYRRTSRARLTWKTENCSTGNRQVWGKLGVLVPETMWNSPKRQWKEWNFSGKSAQPFCRTVCKAVTTDWLKRKSKQKYLWRGI